MPKRTDIPKILIIGAGPIVIGQACEFDYSGTQACHALRQEGYQTVLINSNPATIMTDIDTADRTYIEPMTAEIIEKIIERERPNALLPTMGGQTALNLAVELVETGVLASYGVALIGASYASIQKAENRGLFKKVVSEAGLLCPKSGVAHNLADARALRDDIQLPVILRTAFTLGGAGGSVVYRPEDFETLVQAGLSASPIHEILIEESLMGWKEFELEVMRDCRDNVVVICAIENIDPMGIHTGDSITVAPAQTLTDRAYQTMRDAALRVIRAVGVDTGGANIQFALHPETGALRVIEMNPRVSRSSALASKATGFPIAKIAAKLAVGLALDEIENDITRVTPASFEPTLDYVVVKIPRFAFEKFPKADPTLTLQMKSVGEVMAIGRNFKEALWKAVRSLDLAQDALALPDVYHLQDIEKRITEPAPDRLAWIAAGLQSGIRIDQIQQWSHIDPWFLEQISEILKMTSSFVQPLQRAPLAAAKAAGWSDAEIARHAGLSEEDIRAWRVREGLLPVYKKVDTCGAEFEAETPYLYSTYEMECEAMPTARPKVVILGSGPNRIGQGIEFDYCCVHAVMALREMGYESIMVNCNPETVSTDYDMSDRLYFEPLTLEDVLHIIWKESPLGVVVQLGGQTPLKLALPLMRAGVKILGTPPDQIDRAEDRNRFKALLDQLGIRQPQSGIAKTAETAREIAEHIGYPVLARPSYVLGGQAMEILYNAYDLERYMTRTHRMDGPILIDQYLTHATEMDVDAVSDGREVFIGGMMEHIEEAGIHSGDSACVLPPFSCDPGVLETVRKHTEALAKALCVIGLINIQFALRDGEVYVLEVNPRASRTVPFVSKAIGMPLAKIAMKVMLGQSLADQGIRPLATPNHFAVKEAVLPFKRFDVDAILGPEMKSTGEVMGIDRNLGLAFAKAEAAAGNRLPLSGTVFLSIRDEDKPGAVSIAKRLLQLGFHVLATAGTATFLEKQGLCVMHINKVQQGHPHIVDALMHNEIALVVNTVGDPNSLADSYPIRRAVLRQGVPYFTTLAGANAALQGIDALHQQKEISVKSLQEYHNPTTMDEPARHASAF